MNLVYMRNWRGWLPGEGIVVRCNVFGTHACRIIQNRQKNGLDIKGGHNGSALVGEGDTIQGWLESMEVVDIGCNFHELLPGIQFFRGKIDIVFLSMVLDTLANLIE